MTNRLYRLTVDLTRYHPDFTVGAIGREAAHRAGMWARGSDRFFPMELPTGAAIDVLWDSVERVPDDNQES